MIAPLRPADPPRAWTVSDLLLWTEAHFRSLEIPSPRLEAEVLLAHALGCKRIDLYTGYRKVVEPGERARFRSAIERRARGEPVAYITGWREFHSLAFEVTPAVLIPRPETEHLVDAVIEHLSPPPAPPAPPAPAAGEAGRGSGASVGEDGPGPAPAAAAASPAAPPRAARVLDLGTGSGNIAVAIAASLPGARVTAIEVSPEALEVARRNTARHGVEDRVEFLEGDLFAPLRAMEPRPRFDAIVSNPPYIPPGDPKALSRGVREFEPALALFDRRAGEGQDGLGFLRAIAREAREFLAPSGLLAVEVGAGQASAVEERFRAAGLAPLPTVTDLGGIPRVVLGLSA